ncbi:hypothetical protein V502_09600 [Pseudogymnoascus sp. VKM F-4520 (FW-2644)]|nr:hypothetical protein V502_09600 [Pseudogymnoascus sp. VKM F-4520 (FW-2644)]
MAVIDTLPGVDISISINGQSVKEYEDAGEEAGGPLGPKTVVKYIEAISDTEFAIKASVLPAFRVHRQSIYDLAFQVDVDGKWAAGRCYLDAIDEAYSPWNSQIEGFYSNDATGRSTVNPFKFADVEIADKDKIDQDVKAAAALGQITVEVLRIKVGAETNRRENLPRQAVSKISEKAVKGRALSHGTAFGVAKIVGPETRTLDCVYLDGRDKPLARFVFRYRSKEALRQLLVIPRTPSPDPFDALPAADRERLAREAFQQQQVSYSPRFSCRMRGLLPPGSKTRARDQTREDVQKRAKQFRRCGPDTRRTDDKAEEDDDGGSY